MEQSRLCTGYYEAEYARGLCRRLKSLGFITHYTIRNIKSEGGKKYGQIYIRQCFHITHQMIMNTWGLYDAEHSAKFLPEMKVSEVISS